MLWCLTFWPNSHKLKFNCCRIKINYESTCKLPEPSSHVIIICIIHWHSFSLLLIYQWLVIILVFSIQNNLPSSNCGSVGGEEESCGKPLKFCMCGLRTKPVSALSVPIIGLPQVPKVDRISKATGLAEGQESDWNIGTIQLFMTPCSSHIKLNLILMDSFIRETTILPDW